LSKHTIAAALAGLAAVGAFASTTASEAATPAGPKAADPPCSVTVNAQPRVGLAKPQIDVPVTLTGCEGPKIYAATTDVACGCPTGFYGILSWNEAHRTTNLSLSTSSATGSYAGVLSGTVQNPDGSSGPAFGTTNKLSVDFRFDTRLSISTHRVGSKVTISSTLVKYAAGNKWAPYGGRVVRFQVLRNGTWKPVATVGTNSHGQAAVTHTQSSAAHYRAVVLDAPRYWGITSVQSYR
jgi:hypothetical protein